MNSTTAVFDDRRRIVFVATLVALSTVAFSAVFAGGAIAEEGEFEVDADFDEDEINAGESILVSTTIENVGDDAAEGAPFELVADGETVTEQPVTVDAGESITVTMSNTFLEAGEYDLELVGPDGTTHEEAQLTVVDPDEADDDADDDDSIPGLGALAATLAIATALIALSIRNRQTT